MDCNEYVLTRIVQHRLEEARAAARQRGELQALGRAGGRPSRLRLVAGRALIRLGRALAASAAPDRSARERVPGLGAPRSRHA